MHVLMIPSWYPTPNNPPLRLLLSRPNPRPRARRPANGRHLSTFQRPPASSSTPLAWHKIGLRKEIDDGVPTYRNSVYRWSDDLRTLSESWLNKGLELFEHYLAQEGRPDLIHVNAAHRAGLLALRIKEKHNIPYVIFEHQSHYVREPRPQWVREELKKCFAAASWRVVVSEKYGEKLEEIMGESVVPFSFIPNAIGESFISRDLPAGAEPGRAIRLLTIGNIIEHKGQDFLLRAFMKCANEHSTWTLTFLGDGPLRAPNSKTWPVKPTFLTESFSGAMCPARKSSKSSINALITFTDHTSKPLASSWPKPWLEESPCCRQPVVDQNPSSPKKTVSSFLLVTKRPCALPWKKWQRLSLLTTEKTCANELSNGLVPTKWPRQLIDVFQSVLSPP